MDEISDIEGNGGDDNDSGGGGQDGDSGSDSSVSLLEYLSFYELAFNELSLEMNMYLMCWLYDLSVISE